MTRAFFTASRAIRSRPAAALLTRAAGTRQTVLPSLYSSFKYYSSASHPLSVPISLPNGIKYDQPTGLFINNEFVPSKSGELLSVESPSTEEHITQVYLARNPDVDVAVDAAEKAFKTWSTAQPSFRGDIMFRLADKIEENLELLASIEVLDNGKAISSARGDIALVAKVIRFYAGCADKNDGTLVDTNDGYFSYTKREPIGVCGQIIPWNFPLLMWAWKIAPALATGNTVVLKTAESTPLSALVACELAKQVGLPPGVMNVISGAGETGAYIANHPKIRKIAFTGSTATGRYIMEAAAKSNLKKVTLELGGKSPHIVFNDADLDKAAEIAAAAIFYNSGEVCCAGSRLYVQEDIYDKFIAKVADIAKNLKVGNPFDEATFQGSQTSKVQLERILKYIDIGKSEGAQVVTGGTRLDSKGYFVAPTVFGNVNSSMKIVQEEIFGPVVVAEKFSTVQEVIDKANDSEYGLAAGVHTQDLNKAIDISNKLHAGSVWVNSYNAFHEAVPFGGFNQSGMGREMGKQGLDNYTQVKAVRIKIEDTSKN